MYEVDEKSEYVEKLYKYFLAHVSFRYLISNELREIISEACLMKN
jgi:hypothetical protein